MASPHSESGVRCDVFVVGAGLVGLAAAIGFARAGYRIVCCGEAEPRGHGRTVALLGPSLEILEGFGLWPQLAPRAAALRRLRIIDDTGSLFAPPPVTFHAHEIDLEAFGWNIENAILADALEAAAGETDGLTRVAGKVAGFDFTEAQTTLRLEDGREFAAALVIGADGRNSVSRKAAGIEARAQRYPQCALTVLLQHTRPHEDVSTEFHTRQGPFTLVPLPPAPGAPHRSSLVWVMSEAEAARRGALDDGALAEEIERQARAMFGAMRIEGARGIFPLARQSVASLTAARLALVGDAAHAFPPIGAQGLNLGLRDVADLIAATEKAADIGDAATLKRYAQSRRLDVDLRSAVVNGLNQALLAPYAPIDALRGLGLAALGHIGPLRRLAMREGLAPSFRR
ncbi:MAG: ubiquinone biosynthesis protein UbiH [Bradyrhizobium sp.]|nr:MAG: ubiquinone biosynthesis protein UbiH [Bradyrhizobium sp.]